jgi:hypothetical protein
MSSSSWRAKVTADGEKVKTDTCLYLPPAALRGDKLPRRLVVEGPTGASKLVGRTRIDGAADESTIRVSAELLGTLASGREAELEVPATIRRASWVDVWAYTERGDILKVIGALVVLAAAIVTAVVAFITRTSGIEIATAALVLACLVAIGTAWGQIHDVISPRCR